MQKTYYVMDNRTMQVRFSGPLDAVLTDLKNLLVGIQPEQVYDFSIAAEEVEEDVLSAEPIICDNFVEVPGSTHCGNCLWDKETHERKRTGRSVWDEEEGSLPDLQ